MQKKDKADKKTRHLSKKQLAGIVAGIFILLVILFDLTITNNIQFYAKWMSCGTKPYEAYTYGFARPVPHYYIPSSYPGYHHSHEGYYYCTALEAEQAGYSADEDKYYYPLLNATK